MIPLLIAFSLYALLLKRLGLLPPVREYRALQAFEEAVGQMADDVAWEDRMQKASEQHRNRHPYPLMYFR